MGSGLRAHHRSLRELTTRRKLTSLGVGSAAFVTLLAACCVVIVQEATSATAPPPGFVVRTGTHLTLDGKPFRFTGVNAYQLATNYADNIGCGPQPPSVSGMIDSLPSGSVVRFWAFQAMADNPTTHQRDWRQLDAVVDAARSHGVKLVMTLSDQSGTCDDGHWHDRAWYQGGFRNSYNDNHKGVDVTSWWDWMTAVVTRYAGSPAIAYWEPVNEPEASNCDPGFSGSECYEHDTCPGGSAEALQDFFTTVGAEIHHLDRWHPVASGTLAQGECGLWEQYFAVIGASPGLDVLTVHDYNPAVHTSSDQRIGQAAKLGKPLVYEEVGTDASPSGVGCVSLQTRADELTAKFRTVLKNPIVAGFLPWQWLATRTPDCATAITPDDPLLQQLSSTARAAA